VLSRPAEMNEMTQAELDATVAKLHAQLVVQMAYLKTVLAVALRPSPAAVAMKEFVDDMRRSDYLASRMAELGVESAYVYWKAVYYGGGSGEQQWR